MAVLKMSGRLAQSPAMRRLLDDVAGRSLVAANGALDEIERFERD